MRKVLLAAAAAVAMASPAAALTIVLDDFETFNPLAPTFNSDYVYKAPTPGNNAAAAEYTVSTNAFPWNTNFKSYGDNTTGAGNYMIVNGAATQETVWQNIVPVALAAGTYRFQFALSDACCETLNLGSGPGVDPFPPLLIVRLGNGQITTADLALSPGTGAGVWQTVGVTFGVSSATTAQFSIVNNRFQAGGNDFGIDDITLSVPEPASWAMMVGGFGLLGATMRRRKVNLTYA